jgi:UDP-N-acetylmuramoyl-L-alanyl-D-glutamate--2,6-diaminopimelate ligase
MAPMRLSELARVVGATHTGADVDVSGVVSDSRQVRPGDLFVAIPGRSTDGLAHLEDARARGAVAVCCSGGGQRLPALVVDDPRSSAGVLAAEVHRHPCRELTLVGVTGTLGKTSTVELMEACLGASDIRVGVIGSLGIHYAGRDIGTGLTTPEAPVVQHALRQMADDGVTVAAMEVTSHSLALGRINGLSFRLGVFTNLVDDEHLDFHGSFERYVQTKFRYFDFLEPGAPLVFNRDEPLLVGKVRSLANDSVGVSLDGADDATVQVEVISLRHDLTRFDMHFTRPLTRLDGTGLALQRMEVSLPIPGIQHVMNTSLAAVASLLAGASESGVRAALARICPIRRRMEILRSSDPLVIDDTVGNPRSLRAVLMSVGRMGARRVHLVSGIRGARGTEINTRLAGELARIAGTMDMNITITSAEDSAGPRDRVSDAERSAFLSVLDAAGVGYDFEPSLQASVRSAISRAGEGDAVLLLGAGGLDEAAAMARPLLDELPAPAGGTNR